MNSGFINVLKPPGMTSHDVVSFVRRTFGIKRVGHAGTLDPGAAGVLPVAVGTATRLLEYLTDAGKSYRAELTFGYRTDTGDDDGRVLETAAFVMPERSRVEEALAALTGTTAQMPPMYSAVKVGGRKLYELARQGLTAPRPSRPATIHRLALLRLTAATLLLDIDCSKGVYIRTLCEDIGAALGIPAVMSFLVRTGVGDFRLEDAATLEEIKIRREAALKAADEVLVHLPRWPLTAAEAGAFCCGRRVIAAAAPEAAALKIYDDQDRFIGIGRRKSGAPYIEPVKVMNR